MNPYFGDLFKAKAISDDNLNAAVDAYMADLTTSRFFIGEHAADLANAVARSPYAQSMLADSKARMVSKRAAVRTAILLAKPVKR